MVILVNENDTCVGTMNKLAAHKKAMLHRAISVFIFNSEKKLLLQQRANDKYHSGGLWTNTCCSHPFLGENVADAAQRRLKQEMGLQTPLHYIFKFTYKAPFDNNLTEHEIDHVFIGQTDDKPVINPAEVAAYKYMYLRDIKEDMANNPSLYTAWFHIIFKNFLANITEHNFTD